MFFNYNVLTFEHKNSIIIIEQMPYYVKGYYMKRIIIHSDLNSFFASVECLKKPWLANVPMAVAGDSEKRHGIILAKNIHAAKFGVKTAEPIWSAKAKCPTLVTVPPNHDDYLVISRRVRKIYEDYSNKIESFGIDECWIDITDIAANFEEAREIADEIRERIHSQIGITASCGVSFNKVFAKLGSDLKKPDATTVIDDESFRELVWELPVDRLLFVGRSTVKTLGAMNIRTIGELANTDILELENVFGKNGVSLWLNANGKDNSPVEGTNTAPSMKSISNSITLPYDITSDEDVRVVLLSLCEKVSARMRRLDYVCNTVQIFVRDYQLNSYERQAKLDTPNRTAACLLDVAFALYKANHPAGRPIRALGVKAANLSNEAEGQLTISDTLDKADKFEKREKIESVTDSIRSQFGKSSLKRGIMLTNNVMADVDMSKNKNSFTKSEKS